MVMKLIRCKKCKAPIILRSRGIEDAFTPQAVKLRRKYRGKLKACVSESSELELCADCIESRT